MSCAKWDQCGSNDSGSVYWRTTSPPRLGSPVVPVESPSSSSSSSSPQATAISEIASTAMTVRNSLNFLFNLFGTSSSVPYQSRHRFALPISKVNITLPVSMQIQMHVLVREINAEETMNQRRSDEDRTKTPAADGSIWGKGGA